MRVKLVDLKIDKVELKNSFKVKDKLIEHTFLCQLSLLIEGKKISCELGQLPLFYPQQDLQVYIGRELYFNLKTKSFDNELPTNLLFCLELAILKYLYKFSKKDIPPHFKELDKCKKIQLNALALAPTQQSYDVDVVKLKIGRLDHKQDNQQIKDLLEKGLRLRLDANQMLRPSELEEILLEIDLSKIEYIEEPFASIDQWESFKLKDRVSLGVDESLLQVLDSGLPTNTGAFIIKPTLNLGLFKTCELIYDPNYSSIKKVISSSFDDEQTINMLIHLAELEKPTTAHGLMTLEHLRLQPKLVYQEGRFLQGFPILSF